MDSPAKAHDFDSDIVGVDIFQRIRVVPGTYMIVLQWDENLASQENTSGAIDDLDIYLVDDEGRLIVGNNRVILRAILLKLFFFKRPEQGKLI